MDFTHEFNSLFDDQFQSEFSSLDNLIQFDSQMTLPPLPEQFPSLGLEEFSELSSDFWDVKPIMDGRGFECFEHCNNNNGGENNRVIIERKYKKSSMLELEEIQKHFDVPISKAARKMNVGLTVLKKRCRELNITRWPHRKLKSLKALIRNVKEMGLTNEVMMLEENKRMLEQLPDTELTEKTKKLRQACFKANYKRRMALARHV